MGEAFESRGYMKPRVLAHLSHVTTPRAVETQVTKSFRLGLRKSASEGDNFLQRSGRRTGRRADRPHVYLTHRPAIRSKGKFRASNTKRE